LPGSVLWCALRSETIIRPGSVFCFREKGGKEKDLPVHHKLEEFLDQYLQATGLGAEPDSFLFPAALRNIGKLSLPAAPAYRCFGDA
jgi:hypothetical protein